MNQAPTVQGYPQNLNPQQFPLPTFRPTELCHGANVDNYSRADISRTEADESLENITLQTRSAPSQIIRCQKLRNTNVINARRHSDERMT